MGLGNFLNGVGEFLGATGNQFVKESARASTLLHSNGAINAIGKQASLMGRVGGHQLDNRIMENEGLRKAIGVKKKSDISGMDRAKSLFYQRNGNLALGRIAGVGFGGAGIASGAYSMVANGSPVRDRNGDFDVPGIPLI